MQINNERRQGVETNNQIINIVMQHHLAKHAFSNQYTVQASYLTLMLPNVSHHFHISALMICCVKLGAKWIPIPKWYCYAHWMFRFNTHWTNRQNLSVEEFQVKFHHKTQRIIHLISSNRPLFLEIKQDWLHYFIIWTMIRFDLIVFCFCNH